MRVTSAEARNGLWYLDLECGHKTTRIIQHVVYDPYPALPAPKHIYCVECPPGRRQNLFADWDKRFDAWSRSHAS